MKRLFEIIPGAFVWLTFFSIIVLSILKPNFIIYFIIVFLIYWIIKISYWFIFLFISFKKFKSTINIDWFNKLKKLKNFNQIYHLIFIPTYKEPFEILNETFKSILNSKYPKDKMIIVLACEERDKLNARDNALKIIKKFGHCFFKLIITFHPDPIKHKIKDEIPGKGSNIAYAGRIVKKFIDKEKIPYKNIIVSSFDADTQVHPQYFSYLTYIFLTTKNPLQKSYQPIALFANNIWKAPWISRLVSTCTTFWLLTELSRPDRLFTFSSHSMSFKALLDVGFWQKNVVTEDSRIFLQCLLKYNGKYSIKPIFLPVSMDIVDTGDIIKSLKELYKQQRRWAYGIEHFPYLMTQFFLKPNTIPLLVRLKYIFILLEGMYTWATAPIVILISTKLPFLNSIQANQSILGYKAGLILNILGYIGLVYICFLSILYVLIIKFYFKNIKKKHLFSLILQWIFFPVTFILWGSLPAIEAQTRLMIKKYLSFNVTHKNRS